jgi:hypothetical protein
VTHEHPVVENPNMDSFDVVGIGFQYCFRRSKSPDAKGGRWISITIDLDPELFHLNAPVIKPSLEGLPFDKINCCVKFKHYVIPRAKQRHKLSTRLYKTGISLAQGSRYSFEGFEFELGARQGPTICFALGDRLHDERFAKIITLLFESGTFEIDYQLEPPEPLRLRF